MLSVIVAPGDSGRLAGLVAALTSAAVQGLVREVFIAGGGPQALLKELCDATGAELIADVASATASARSELLLVVSPAWRPKEGWVERLGDHLRDGGRDALIGGLGGRFFRPAPSAILIGREKAAGAADLASLRRRLGSRAPKLA